MKKRNIFKALLFAGLFTVCTGCSTNDIKIESLSDLANLDVTIGVPSDYDVSSELNDLCKSCKISYIEDVKMGVNSVLSGKIDGYALGNQVFEEMDKEGSLEGIKVLEDPIKTFEIGLGLSQLAPIDNYKLKVDTFIMEIEQNGVLADMTQRWLVDSNFDFPQIDLPDNPTYTLKAVTWGGTKPYSFIKDNDLVGFDVELVYRLAAYLGYGINLQRTEYPSMLLGLSTGKYDVVSANLYISDERSENVLYSTPYSRNYIQLGVKDYSASSNSDSFWTKIKDGFDKTFVQENRWQMILSGLGITLLITFFGFVLGNILGGIFCYFSMSKNKVLNVLYGIYSRIMQGVPIVVILMVLYYIIFATSSISGIYVAIIGFGLTTGSSLAIQFKGAVTSVPKEQKEAALALGLTKFQTAKGIIFPQAVRKVLPGYFAEIIALLKATSIVGYIAVTDLTKAGDLIRNATYEAIFSLLSIALIYFLISFLLIALMNFIQKKLLPKKINNTKEGGKE